MVQFSSEQIKSISLTHTILGLSIWALCKFQIYYTRDYLSTIESFRGIVTVIFEILSIVVYVWLMLKNRI